MNGVGGEGGGRGLLLNGWESDRKASDLEPSQPLYLGCSPGLSPWGRGLE